jgi:hypothetical protein
VFKVSVSREEEFTAKPQRSQRGAEVEELFVIGEEEEVNIEHPTLNIEVGEDEEAAFSSAIHDLRSTIYYMCRIKVWRCRC